MIDAIVFWGLCATLVFLPLPIGSVEEWAIFVFEAATLGLFLLHIAGRAFAKKPDANAGSPRVDPQAWGIAPTPADGPGASLGPARLPLFVKVLLGLFVAISVLQIVPLPAGVVRALSPKAFDIYAGLVQNGLAAPASRLTLSLVPAASLAELVLVLCYGLFGYLVLRTVRTRRRAEILVVVVLASALFQALFGMVEVFSGHEHLLGRPKRYNLGSVTGTYVNRNHLAGFLEMAFPLALGYLLVKARYFAMEKGLSLRRKIVWFGQESLQWTLLLGLVPVFIALGIVFSKSRSGILVLALTTVLAAASASSWREFSEGDAANGKGSGRRRFGAIVRAVAAVVLAAAVWLGIGPVVARFSEVDVTAEARRTFYRNTLDLIGDFPLAGTGKGTYVNAYPMVEKVDDRLRLSFAHNDYLEYASENGVVAAAALALAGLGLLVWLAALWRRRRDPFAKGLGLGAGLAFTAILVHGLTDFNLQITANAVHFVTMAMLAAAVLVKRGDARLRDTAKALAPRPRPLRRVLFFLLAPALAVALFVPAVRDFAAFRHLAAYRAARAQARSVESAFPALEARLARAAAVSPRAVFEAELARLTMEMARVANAAGRDEERDTLCDRAIARYARAIAANPIDAAVHYETGLAYLLVNYPLMTYQDRAKASFRQALALKPADETMNLNVVYLYFSWWPTLDDAEAAYAAGLYRAAARRDPAFPAKLRARWAQSAGPAERLNAILAALPPLQ